MPGRSGKQFDGVWFDGPAFVECEECGSFEVTEADPDRWNCPECVKPGQEIEVRLLFCPKCESDRVVYRIDPIDLKLLRCADCSHRWNVPVSETTDTVDPEIVRA